MLGCKILVADDEDHVLRIVALKLRNAGYRVTTATDGNSALEAARLDRPDLLITDLQMPGINGLELCLALSGPDAEGSRPVPSILLTARIHDLERLGPTPSNVRRVIAKPFSPRQLVEGVRELLGEAA